MKLQFMSKSLDYLNGEPYKTRVVLGNNEGAIYPIFFKTGHIDKSAEELIALALEQIYQENYPNRAENEKFNMIGKKISEIDDAIERANGQYTKMEQMMQNITTTMNALLDGGEDEKTTTSVK